MPGRGNPKRPPFDRPPPRTAPPDAAGRSQARGRHRLRPRSPQARPHRKIRQRLPTRVPPRLQHRLSRSCTQRGPMKHRRSRPTDLSRGAVSSGAHGLQIWACRARSPRIVQLVSALLRRAVCSSPYVPARWSTVAPNEGRSRQPVVGVGGRSARPAGSPRECPGGRCAALWASSSAAGQRADDFHKVSPEGCREYIWFRGIPTELRCRIIPK